MEAWFKVIRICDKRGSDLSGTLGLGEKSSELVPKLEIH